MRGYYHSKGEPHTSCSSSSMSIARNIFIAMITTLSVSGCQTSETSNHTFSTSKSASREKTNIAYNFDASANWNPYIGNSSHICSPSGFGRQSHCFLRI